MKTGIKVDRNMKALYAVSYTHLDVYKRQELINEGEFKSNDSHQQYYLISLAYYNC